MLVCLKSVQIYRQEMPTRNIDAGMNVLCGVGILSTPYAVKQGGWIGISILVLYAVISFYTGILLRRCLESQQGLHTYPDIGKAAFGTWGRIIISVGVLSCFHSFPKSKFITISID